MHANLVRSYTNPVNPQARLHTSNSSTSVGQYANNHDSHASTNSQPSRSSDSTQNTSSSTLFNPPMPGPSGTVAATDNVINRVADKETSLFQVSMTLRARLAGVPGLEEQILEVEDELQDEDKDPIDPIMLLWNVFRRGYPLMTIYNALGPPEPLEVDESTVTEKKRADLAAYKFLQACITKLGFPTSECYMLGDLKMGTSREVNMSGFVKVVKQVNRVVDILIQRGIIESYDSHDPTRGGPAPGAKRSHREHVVDELIRTERTYVQHLGLLQEFSRHVRDNGVITHDAIHDIFLNLDQLLEFQQRFLSRIEAVNAQAEIDQDWGKLFLSAAQHSSGPNGTIKDFRVYEPFIENQKRCEETTMREFEKLRQAGGPAELRQMVESPTHLTSFLLKPFQRLSKYPLLLKELRDKGRPSPARKETLTAAIEAVTAILHRTNDVLDREERQQAVRDLKAQVEDWKHHRVEAFGDLLLYGNHTVLKGDPTRDNEREYRMYLFEKILLCCKEINPNKAKNKVKPQAQPDKKGRPKLQLKGRIFMQNVTDTVFSSKPGNYTCQIFWRGDEVIEHFVIRFATDEIMKKWCSRIATQRQVCQDQARYTPRNTDTEFHYMSSQPQMENPYREDDQQDDDDRHPPPSIGYAESANFPTSRNGSSTSLRSRSTTGESGPPMGTGRGMKPPLSNLPPLTIRSQNSAGFTSSPGERMGASYFSPGNDSPVSSRTSASSNLFPPQRQGSASTYPQPDDHRYTAPARERSSLAKDASGNYYATADNRAPSQPYAASLAQSRYRSASNPDVQHPANRRTVANAPPVPSVPHHLAHGSNNVNRSSNNSPLSPEKARQASGPRGYHADSSNLGYEDASARQEQYDPFRAITPLPIHTGHHGMVSPPLGSASTLDGLPLQPSQLKVKVRVPSEGSAMTLVVGFNITFEKLKDRIDAKLQRNTNVLLSTGAVKLKYWDDDEYISIQTDEDVQTAFETWKEQQQEDIVGQLGEIELFCHPSG